MDRFESMSVFARVVERGSFVAAAEEFRLSATMAGQHVRALEARLGGRLLNRTTRRQSLTELGQAYYARCKAILAQVDAAEAVAAELQGEARGRLRVMTPVSFGVHALAPACGDYLARYPAVEIDLVVSDRPANMVEEGFEVVVRIGDLADSQMIARPLSPYRSVLAASPAYLARRPAPERPEDLSAHACLGFAHPAAGRTWRLEGPKGEAVVPVTLAMSANNGEALRMAALSGLGIIMQPQVLLAADIEAGRLVRVLPAYAPRPRPMHVLTLPDKRPSPKVRSFVEFVIGRFGRRA
jgi:DNA-binding transcriptional LysR family regulator